MQWSPPQDPWTDQHHCTVQCNNVCSPIVECRQSSIDRNWWLRLSKATAFELIWSIWHLVPKLQYLLVWRHPERCNNCTIKAIVPISQLTTYSTAIVKWCRVVLQPYSTIEILWHNWNLRTRRERAVALRIQRRHSRLDDKTMKRRYLLNTY